MGFWGFGDAALTRIPDAVLEDYVEDAHSAEQIAAERGFEMEVVRRVVRMVDRAEYKRQQAAPGIKISPKAFGYGRRFPIAAKHEVWKNPVVAPMKY